MFLMQLLRTLYSMHESMNCCIMHSSFLELPVYKQTTLMHRQKHRQKHTCLLTYPQTLLLLFLFAGMFVSLAYLISPRFCHRFVGFLEEEAVRTLYSLFRGKRAHSVTSLLSTESMISFPSLHNDFHDIINL